MSTKRSNEFPLKSSKNLLFENFRESKYKLINSQKFAEY